MVEELKENVERIEDSDLRLLSELTNTDFCITGKRFGQDRDGEYVVVYVRGKGEFITHSRTVTNQLKPFELDRPSVRNPFCVTLRKRDLGKGRIYYNLERSRR